MDDSQQTEAITTIKLPVPSCTLSRADLVELARPMEDIAGEEDWQRPRFVIEGRDRTLTCRSLKALEDSSWPRDVKKVRLSGDGEAGREITFWASTDLDDPQQFEISGQDALWVQGVAQYYRDMLNDRRNWHWLANNLVVWLVLMPLAAPFWLPRLFPLVEVQSGAGSRASVLRRRAASVIGVLLLIGLGVLGTLVGTLIYNLLT